MNGTGTLLGTINLAAQNRSNCVGDPNGEYCNFTAAGLSFDGVGRSIDFFGTANYVVFDNITFGAATPITPVPEPGTYAMLGLGLTGIAAYRRLSQRKA